MATFQGSPGFAHGRPPRIGVLVANLGTPEAPTPRAVRRYLAEFLSDPRVIETPRWLWWPILHGVILNVRPRRSAHAYASIWREDGSPLLTISQRLATQLGAALNAPDDQVALALGMRYGEPSIARALDALTAANARRIVVLPLYPQYAAPTTASVADAVAAWQCRQRWVPEMRLVGDYHDDARYIGALAASIEAHWAANGRGAHLLLSFHGLPRDYFLAGDPYYCQCQATARLLAARLGLAPSDYSVTFQSRVGPKRWLEPYTDLTIDALGAQKLATLDVVCPGFAVDCLETLEEIALQYGARFQAAGGGELRYIPALNDDRAHVDALAGIVEAHFGNWRALLRAQDPAAAAARAITAGAPQ